MTESDRTKRLLSPENLGMRVMLCMVRTIAKLERDSMADDTDEEILAKLREQGAGYPKDEFLDPIDAMDQLVRQIVLEHGGTLPPDGHLKDA